jgi:hypothetical protein
MKLVVDAETDRILGAAILASEGGEVVQILHAVMLAGAPYTILASEGGGLHPPNTGRGALDLDGSGRKLALIILPQTGSFPEQDELKIECRAA